MKSFRIIYLRLLDACPFRNSPYSKKRTHFFGGVFVGDNGNNFVVSTIGIPRTEWEITNYYETCVYVQGKDEGTDLSLNDHLAKLGIPTLESPQRYDTSSIALIGHQSVVTAVKQLQSTNYSAVQEIV